MNPKKLPSLVAVLLAAAAASGCAMQPYPVEELARARTAVEAAAAVPASPEEAARAERKLALTQRWIDARDYGPVQWLAEQAEVDAELAIAKAAAGQARQALETRDASFASLRKTSHRPH